MRTFRWVLSLLKKYEFGKTAIAFVKKIVGMDQQFGISSINVAKSFPIYWPGSAGTYHSISKQAILAIRETIPLLANFVKGDEKVVSISDYTKRFVSVNDQILGDLLCFYGSDKSTNHNYHIAYAHILGEPEKIKKIFEIGLGTNNTSINSNMSKMGKPGASCRAFRDYLPNAIVYGADIDREILFEENRIFTHYLDQTDSKSFEALEHFMSGDFDLMIDDGLHSINANLRSLNFFLSKLRKGGFAVIEDIPEWSIDFWFLVPRLIGPVFESTIVRTKNSYLFVVEKL